MPHASHRDPDAPSTQTSRCGDAPARLSLKVLDSPRPTPAQRQRRKGRIRAFVLLSVHLVILGHILHWLLAGSTLTPVEPSEAMETIKTGGINAGFLFFAAALLATLILGRWVCGWACHLVAYQDLTLWVLKRFHLRPRAFRSRLLAFVPLFAALYMFVWPAVVRWWVGAESPPITWHLTRSGFWDTFPGPIVAVLTILIAGMSIIYFLGPKGFCFYACPYGGFFSLADRLAPWRIRVNDDCESCGHCTAVCTSNVDVAAEVKRFGMVVDSGCMKCLDCVTICPNDALSYGIGRPSLGAKAASPPRPRQADLSWLGEIGAAIVFVGFLLAFRGLYGRVPFLLSLAIAGIGTFLSIKAAHLILRRDVLLQKIKLKVAGRVRPAGWAFVLLMLAVAAVTAHAAMWRYHDFAGQRAFNHSRPEEFGWQYDPNYAKRLSPAEKADADLGLRHLVAAEDIAFVPSHKNLLEIAWLAIQTGDFDRADESLRHVIAMLPDNPILWLNLAKLETHQGDLDAAEMSLREAVDLVEAASLDNEQTSTIWTEYGLLLQARGQMAEARSALEKAVSLHGVSQTARTALGMAQIRMGEIDAARRSLIAAVSMSPQQSVARGPLAQLAKADQDYAAALADYDAAIDKNESVAVFHANIAWTLVQLDRKEEAVTHYRKALAISPNAHDIRADLGALLLIMNDVDGAIREYENIHAAMPDNATAAMRLAFLYAQAGRTNDAVRLCREIAQSDDEANRAAAQALLRELQ